MSENTSVTETVEVSVLDQVKAIIVAISTAVMFGKPQTEIAALFGQVREMWESAKGSDDSDLTDEQKQAKAAADKKFADAKAAFLSWVEKNPTSNGAKFYTAMIAADKARKVSSGDSELATEIKSLHDSTLDYVRKANGGDSYLPNVSRIETRGKPKGSVKTPVKK